MKKIILISTMLMLSLLFTACATRTPFSKQIPLDNSTLVYIYVSSDVGIDESINDSFYTIRVNNKLVASKIMKGEYVAFDLKPVAVKITAAREEVELSDIYLDLKEGQTYYLKIRGELSNGGFEFQKVDSTLGLKELAKTGLAGTHMNFMEDKAEEVIQIRDANSNTEDSADEIQRLYDMKEKGILTQEEFETLKTKVIN